jgi:anti-anti-sigma factor
MALSIEQRLDQNIGIFALKGPMTLGPSLHALSTSARKLLDSGALAGIILDVSEVTLVDSAGLGELTLVYTFAARRSCPVVLAGVTPSLKHSLEITRLEALLPMAPDVESARAKIAEKKANTTSGA